MFTVSGQCASLTDATTAHHRISTNEFSFPSNPSSTRVHFSADNHLMESCSLQFAPSDYYVPPYLQPGYYYHKNSVKRSFDKSIYDDINTHHLKKESLNLISRNLVKDVFVRPLNGFIKYYLTAKSVVYG